VKSASLIRHPQCHGPNVSIRANASRLDRGALVLSYLVDGDVDRLLLQAAAQVERGEELWKSTCFEAFVASGDGGYCEINLSPSRQWAVYRFDQYRAGMRDFAPGHIDIQSVQVRSYLMECIVGLPQLSVIPKWHVGLAAVVEALDGSKSYWALSHPAAKPDFHHPDSFTLELA
jgi:hypothetical protein